jgi:hypothetical protein
MTRKGWIFAGSTAALAGAFALSLAQAPATAPPVVAAATPDPVSAPAPAAVAAPVVASAIPGAPRTSAVAPAPGIVSGSAGMVIALDPETGETGLPSPQQLAEMKLTETDIVDRDHGGIVTQLPNGAIKVDLQGRGQDYAVIKRTADGKVVAGCIQRPEDLEHVNLTPTELEEK